MTFLLRIFHKNISLYRQNGDFYLTKRYQLITINNYK